MSFGQTIENCLNLRQSQLRLLHATGSRAPLHKANYQQYILRLTSTSPTMKSLIVIGWKEGYHGSLIGNRPVY